MYKITLALMLLPLFSGCFTSKKKPDTAPLLTPAATTPACSYEVLCDCPAPGQTLLWELQYCQAKLKVNQCDTAYKCADQMKKKFKKQLKNKTNCQKNEFWREKYCKDFQKKNLKQCLKEIPPLIEKGCKN